MDISYHLLNVEDRKVVDLRKYESDIRYVANRFPMITSLTVSERYFTMCLNVTDYGAKRGIIRAFFTQLAQTSLKLYGNFTGGTFKVFIEKKPTGKKKA